MIYDIWIQIYIYKAKAFQPLQRLRHTFEFQFYMCRIRTLAINQVKLASNHWVTYHFCLRVLIYMSCTCMLCAGKL